MSKIDIFKEVVIEKPYPRYIAADTSSLQWVAVSIGFIALIVALFCYRPVQKAEASTIVKQPVNMLATDIKLTEIAEPKEIVAKIEKAEKTAIAKFLKDNPYKKTKTKKLNSPIYKRYKKTIDKAAKTYGLEPSFITAVIWQESRGNPKAVSSAGAIGLMQLMPATAKGLGVNPYDPVQNIMGGSKYLSIQLKRFKSKAKALAAYNAGPGNVKHYKKIKETREYVPRVLAYEKQLNKTV